MVEIFTNALNHLRGRCIEGIEPDEKICQEFAEKSLGLAAALVPHIGYSRASEVAQHALTKGKSLFETVLELGFLTEEEIQKILDPKKMTEPNL
jgi:aspartate ammonia-lyase